MREKIPETDSGFGLAEIGAFGLAIFLVAYGAGKPSTGEDHDIGLPSWLAEWSGSVDLVPFLFLVAFVIWSIPQWKPEERPSKITVLLAAVVCCGAFLALSINLVNQINQSGLTVLAIAEFALGPIVVWSLWRMRKIEESKRSIRLKGITLLVLAAIEVQREWLGSVLGPL